MNRQIRNVAVTGAAGFIGSHVVDELLKDQTINVVVGMDALLMGTLANLSHITDKRFNLIECDIRDHDRLSLRLSKYRIDAVLHLATTPLVFSLKSPREAAGSIIDMQFSLLESLRQHHYTCLVSLSTSEVYGSSPDIVLDESSRVAPQTPYAAAKLAADVMTLSYYHSFALDCTIIRPFNNYGPRKRVLPGAGIIPSAIQCISEGRPVQIFGDGSASRDFVFVTDTARAILMAMRNQASSGELFNVASGVSRSIKDIAGDLHRKMGRSSQIEFVADRRADVSRLCGNGEKIKMALGFTPEVNWEEGIRRCVEYYSSPMKIHPEQ